MVGRGERAEQVRAAIAPLLPANGGWGQRWKGHRTIINGVLGKVRPGAPWRDLPERDGPWQTGSDRFTCWRRDGT